MQTANRRELRDIRTAINENITCSHIQSRPDVFHNAGQIWIYPDDGSSLGAWNGNSGYIRLSDRNWRFRAESPNTLAHEGAHDNLGGGSESQADGIMHNCVDW